MYKSVSLLFVMVALAVGSAARADDAALAKQHFTKGTAHFNVGEFNEAADEYREAYKLMQDPIILYNVAQAYRLGGDFNKAIFFYHSYLRNLPNASNRKEVLERLKVLEAQVAKTKEAALSPPNLPLGVDKSRQPQPQEEPPPAEVKPDTAPSTAPTTPPPSSETTTTTTTRTDLVAVAPAPKTPIYKKWWFWTATAVVVVGVGVGVGLGVGLSGGHGAPATDLGTRPVF